MQTGNAQISLCICAVWSGPNLSTDRIIWYYRMYEWRAKAWVILCTCAGWSESVHFVHVRRHVFTWCSTCIFARCLEHWRLTRPDWNFFLYGKMLVFSIVHMFMTRLELFYVWENVSFSAAHMFMNRLEFFCVWENVSFSTSHIFVNRLEPDWDFFVNGKMFVFPHHTCL